jgi:hypothetical protein
MKKKKCYVKEKMSHIKTKGAKNKPAKFKYLQTKFS